MDERWGNDGKRAMKNKEDIDEEYEEEEEEEVNNNKRVNNKRGSNSRGGGGGVTPYCQVDSCNADLSDAKQYHKRHKVCEFHAKAPAVLIAHQHQRFCQQCSRFHELSEFDDSKRSCRRRLAGHNERRRKNASEYQGSE